MQWRRIHTLIVIFLVIDVICILLVAKKPEVIAPTIIKPLERSSSEEDFSASQPAFKESSKFQDSASPRSVHPPTQQRKIVKAEEYAAMDIAASWGVEADPKKVLPQDPGERKKIIKSRLDRNRFLAYQRILTLALSTADISEETRERAIQAMLASSIHESYDARVRALERELSSILPSDFFEKVKALRNDVPREGDSVALIAPSEHAREGEVLFYTSALGLNPDQKGAFENAQRDVQAFVLNYLTQIRDSNPSQEERMQLEQEMKVKAKELFLNQIRQSLTENQFNRFQELEKAR